MKAKDFIFGESVLLYKPNEDIYKEAKGNISTLIHGIVTRTNIEVTTVSTLIRQ